MSFERAVIACMALYPECEERGLSEFEDADFTDGICIRVFNAYKDMKKRGKSIDALTLMAEFYGTDMEKEIPAIIDELVVRGSFGTYAKAVKDARKFRELKIGLSKCLSMIELEDERVFDQTQSVIDSVRGMSTGSADRFGDGSYNALAEIADKQMGLPTGYRVIDKYLRGLQPGNLIIVGGRASMGKSTFAMNIVQNVLRSGNAVAYITLEDDAMALGKRMIASMSGRSFDQIANAVGDSADIACAVAGQIAQYKLYVNDNVSLTPESIASYCYTVRNKEKRLDLIVIDYLGMIQTADKNARNRQEEIARITRFLKVLAMKLHVPLILVCQLNRNADVHGESGPRMSDLRESGAIEQDADVILFPFRPSYYADDCDKSESGIEEAKVVIAKNRNGITGEIDMKWNGSLFRFYEVTE